MKALITNAAMTLLDDQITNAAEKGVVDESYGLIPNGYLLIQDGLISALGPMSALPEYLAEHLTKNLTKNLAKNPTFVFHTVL